MQKTTTQDPGRTPEGDEMATDALFEERRKALEEEHFRRRNEALLAHMRAEVREAREVRALEEASGIADERLLDELVRHGITTETLPAFVLLPLLDVAWADGKIDDYERRALLEDPGARALEPGSAAAVMFSSWLVERPSWELFRFWAEFNRDACQLLGPDSSRAVESDMLRRAKAIAKASGPFLGFGSSVSREEHRELDRIKAVYEAG